MPPAGGTGPTRMGGGKVSEVLKGEWSWRDEVALVWTHKQEDVPDTSWMARSGTGER